MLMSSIPGSYSDGHDGVDMALGPIRVCTASKGGIMSESINHMYCDVSDFKLHD